MTIPMYVSPEQFMKDRADYARKGIARGRSVVVRSCAEGILFVAENPSSTLHKVSEIYDRIGFAAVGKYTEFEHLRVIGIRYADMHGYAYDRSDVTARALANAYARTLGTVFTNQSKPYEIELTVAELAAGASNAGDASDPETDQLYRLTYDGSVSDEPGLVAMGGAADALTTALRSGFDPTKPVDDALPQTVAELGRAGRRDLSAGDLEVALLDRRRPRRAFRRIPEATVAGLIGQPDPTGSD